MKEVPIEDLQKDFAFPDYFPEFDESDLAPADNSATVDADDPHWVDFLTALHQTNGKLKERKGVVLQSDVPMGSSGFPLDHGACPSLSCILIVTLGQQCLCRSLMQKIRCDLWKFHLLPIMLPGP